MALDRRAVCCAYCGNHSLMLQQRPSLILPFYLVRTALLWNLLAVLPTLYFFFLPKGSVVEITNFYLFWLCPISACILFIGIPCYITSILRRRARRLSYIPEIFALLFCLTPLLLAMSILYLAGAVRGLQAPWYADGGSLVKWTDGYYYPP